MIKGYHLSSCASAQCHPGDYKYCEKVPDYRKAKMFYETGFSQTKTI